MKGCLCYLCTSATGVSIKSVVLNDRLTEIYSIANVMNVRRDVTAENPKTQQDRSRHPAVNTAHMFRQHELECFCFRNSQINTNIVEPNSFQRAAASSVSFTSRCVRMCTSRMLHSRMIKIPPPDPAVMGVIHTAYPFWAVHQSR